MAGPKAEHLAELGELRARARAVERAHHVVARAHEERLHEGLDQAVALGTRVAEHGGVARLRDLGRAEDLDELAAVERQRLADGPVGANVELDGGLDERDGVLDAGELTVDERD